MWNFVKCLRYFGNSKKNPTKVITTGWQRNTLFLFNPLKKKISELFCSSAKIQPKAGSWHRKNIKSVDLCSWQNFCSPFLINSNAFHCWTILLKEGGVSPIYKAIMLSVLLPDRMPAARSLAREKIRKNMVTLLNWAFAFIYWATCCFRSVRNMPAQ